MTSRILATRRRLEAGIRELGLTVWGEPKLSILTFGSRDLNMGATADALASRGWFVGRLAEPPGIHLMLNLTHESVVDDYVADLKWALEEAERAGHEHPAGNATY